MSGRLGRACGEDLEAGNGINHTHMRRAGKFQPAADNRALQRGNDRDAAIFHLVESLVPA